MANIVHITTRKEHDDVVSEADSGVPTVISLMNDATPVCKAFTPEYEELAARRADTGIRFCRMEFNRDTSMMFKFAPNQLPVNVGMHGGNWCRTAMGADVKALEAIIEQLCKQVEKSRS